MSFANRVKAEVVNIECDDECLKATLLALTRLNANIVISDRKYQIQYKTTSLPITRLIVLSVKRLYNHSPDILAKERLNLDYKNIYYCHVDDALDILEDFKMVDDNNILIDNLDQSLVSNEEAVKAYIRGAFLARGSISDPNQLNYHLEIVCSSEIDSEFIKESLRQFGINAKVIERKKGYVVYVKSSEQIGDFLKLIGSYNSLFEFEDARIKRDLNNSINRIINCDLANSTRTLESARKQLESIQIIEENVGLDSLSTRLMEAIILRTTYPDYSLAELSEASEELIGRNISKSGLNHCFRSINQMADNIKK